MWLVLQVTLLLPVIITAMPGGIAKSAAVSANFDTGAAPSLFTFDKGNVGVNFLGYRASAGLGGLLTGNTADGGLHASAGTPFGQSAGAGLGGGVDANGRSAGALYAGATAGGGVSAGAGLAGGVGAEGSVGKSYAGASSGGFSTHVTKVAQKVSAPVVEEVEIVEEEKPRTTYVERTVIPNYVEKTIQVPTYVEKTIRVPTTVEKKIRVPAEPTIIEKTVEAPQAEVVKQVETVPQTVTYVQKTKVHGHHHPHLHSRVSYKTVGTGGGFGGFGGGFGGGYGGGFGGGYGGGFGGGSQGDAAATYTVSKTTSPQLYNDIFNIPISALGAVNKLLNGISGGGSLSVSKSYGVAG